MSKKSRTYTRELSTMVLLTTLTTMIVNFGIGGPVLTSKASELGEVEEVVVEDNEPTPVYSVGVAEVINVIDVEPIYLTYEESSEETDDLVVYNFELTGYIDVNTELNVRQYPSTDADIIAVLTWMDKVEYSIVDDEWACIKLNDTDYGYIHSSYIVDNEETYATSYTITGDEAKTWMSYKTITCTTSKQYALQLRATTNEENGLRMLRGRYMVAIGTYFGCSVGQYIDVVLDDGEVLKCIVGDIKQNRHTDSQNIHGLNGDTVEFIVSEKVLKDTTNVIGDVSYISDTFDGKVVEVRVYNHVEY